MGVLETLRQMGGCTGGVTVYGAAKAAADARNSVPGAYRKRRALRPEVACRLQPLFPELDLDRVRIRVNCSLPGNWFASGDDVDAMTFGYTIYFEGSGYQTDEAKLPLLIHELAHVEQVRRLGGETEFACEYGKGFLAAGSYEANPLEVEARHYQFDVAVPPPCTYDSASGGWGLPAAWQGRHWLVPVLSALD